MPGRASRTFRAGTATVDGARPGRDPWDYTTAMALALASPVLDLRVTQVANQSWGVHALLPAGAIS